MGEATLNSVGQTLARYLARQRQEPDNLVHIGKGNIEALAAALADDVDRRLRQFSNDDPTGDLCGGCAQIALIAAAGVVGDRLGSQLPGDDTDAKRAAFLASLAESMRDASRASLRGMSATEAATTLDH